MQEKDIYLRIGKNIRKYRLEKGYSQEMLSEIIDASDKFIGHIERAERRASIRKLIKISQVLEIDIKYLFLD